MEEDTGDIGREHFLTDLSARQEEAVELLYDPKMDQFLGKLVYSFRQGQDKNDVRQELALMILGAGSDLLAVKNVRAWLCAAAVNVCRNDYRHGRVVRRHCEKCADEGARGKMRGGAVVLQRPSVKTPEQLMQEREQEEQLENKLHGFLESLPHDMQVVAWMWDEDEKSPSEIAEAIGKSDKTVYRQHKSFQRALVERCLAEGVTPDEKQLREVVDDLAWLALVA